jgi:prohibitin 2
MPVVSFVESSNVDTFIIRHQVISAVSGSKDLQMVQIAIRVLFKPDPQELAFIYRRLGKGNFFAFAAPFTTTTGSRIRVPQTLIQPFRIIDYEERVLPSIINEVTKAVIAQYNASELLTKREFVSAQIRNMLVKRAGEFGILLDDVSITNLLFSPAYAAAVEAKQVAQQDSERAKYVVERAIQEKRTIIIRAEGEAKSAMLIGAVSFVACILMLLTCCGSNDFAIFVDEKITPLRYLASTGYS